jgi:uncharacterized protein YkwD
MVLSCRTLRSLLRLPAVTRTGRRFLSLLAGLGTVAAVVAVVMTSTGQAAEAAPIAKSARMSGPAAQVLALTNAQRAKAGCKPLHADPRLTRAAQQHSEDMANRSYFSHTSRGGQSWASRQIRAGWSSERTGGENIARGVPNARTVMNGWMHSPPHRKNILNCEFTTIGVGYESDGDYWTQDFGY